MICVCQSKLQWFLDSASDNLFAHTQKLCTPYFFFPLLLPAEQTPYSYTWDQENLDDDGFSHTLSTTPWVLNWKIPVVLLQNTTKIWGVGSAKKPSNRIWTKKSPDFFRAFTLRIFITKEKRQSGKKGFHFVSVLPILFGFMFSIYRKYKLP